jgi:hypothetical protein
MNPASQKKSVLAPRKHPLAPLSLPGPASRNAAIAVFGRVSAAYSVPSSKDATVRDGAATRDFPISADAVLRHRRISRPRFFRAVSPWLSYL